MKRLIQRYLITVENTRHQSLAPQPQPERLDGVIQLRDLIIRLEGVLEKTGAEDSRRSPAGVAENQREVTGQISFDCFPVRIQQIG